MHNLPIIVIVIIVIGLLAFAFSLGEERQFTRQCIIWQELERDYPLFEMDISKPKIKNVVEQCALQGIIIK